MSDLYGLIGGKLGHSFSPIIHHLILKKINKGGNYNLFEIESGNLKKSVEALKTLKCRGVNVTIPHKIKIMQYIDEVSMEAEKIGAVNTIEFCDNRLKGYNTDYYGFGLTLKKYNIDISNKNIVILGTGGASKAAVRYLIDNNCSDITYVSRNPEKTSENDCKIISYKELYNINNSDIIINCTPCGMYPNVEVSPVDKDILNNFSAAVDLIYNPNYTLFLKYGRELGIKTVNGLYMLVAQAVASQQIWQKKSISMSVIDEIYNELSK
ncbi:shikimate dehydrogenase [Clostridium tyrobutyricum]|uniref:shikimate dehydrogenase n=1 Tax=Clostridium tyrobutyricum TaxID=1519 RepID=UPI00073D3076|nr:shikimate dehydrogenase [Clostridium tyrobutyricum]